MIVMLIFTYLQEMDVRLLRRRLSSGGGKWRSAGKYRENIDYTLKATANATLFKVLLFRNGIRYLSKILDFEVRRLCTLRNGKNIHT